VIKLERVAVCIYSQNQWTNCTSRYWPWRKHSYCNCGRIPQQLLWIAEAIYYGAQLQIALTGNYANRSPGIVPVSMASHQLTCPAIQKIESQAIPACTSETEDMVCSWQFYPACQYKTHFLRTARRVWISRFKSVGVHKVCHDTLSSGR
jgi:hypothetical protein